MINRFIRKLKRSKLTVHSFRTLFSFFSHLPRQKNLVMFESFNGRQYSDNPRAIYEYLAEHYPSYKLVWSADRRFHSQFEDKGLDVAYRFSLKWLWLMPRAKYWVSNSRFPESFRKPPSTVYLQTWHGTPLKRLGVDIEEVVMPGTTTEKYKKNFVSEAQRWDYLVSPNRYSSDIFKRAFGFTNEMLETGYPRNDSLFTLNNQESIERLKKETGLPLDKKIILYAPTWRDNDFYEVGKYKFKIQLNLKKLQEQLGEEYIILCRFHYLVAENLDVSEYEGFVYDFSRYEDIRNLYLMSDMLITDYSSVFFDFAILQKPMLFYVYDIEMYRDQLRGFYFDFEKKAPGPLVKTTDEVIDAVQALSSPSYKPSPLLEEFQRQFTYLEDGHATERVVKKVFTNT
ncbi:CDP-glycerol--glycerophosphate glycerophosphotransferase [Priestia megaterium]|nr:CDP-glycerol--glycerophosphate glycerophosphotransferase [Priestia megaterium]